MVFTYCIHIETELIGQLRFFHQVAQALVG
jgi:hypothetical protein